jgi:hypothetical protein
MDIRRAGPREPQLTGGEEDGAENDNTGHRLWGHFAGQRVLAVAVDDPAEERLACNGDEDPDADASKGKAAESGGPAALCLEGDWVGDEAKVKNAVDEGNIAVPEDAVLVIISMLYRIESIRTERTRLARSRA